MNNYNKIVAHPQYYKRYGRKECWTEMEEKFGNDATIIFCALNAYKYKYRAGMKDGNSKEQDYAKMQNYLDHAKSIMLSYPNSISENTQTVLTISERECFND